MDRSAVDKEFRDQIDVIHYKIARVKSLAKHGGNGVKKPSMGSQLWKVMKCKLSLMDLIIWRNGSQSKKSDPTKMGRKSER